ncbi:MAG: alpha-L-rhamnosidase [Bacteroidales bacterium]|nr:alpha-L-rhamnosidase [Bacteroidales bacterium]
MKSLAISLLFSSLLLSCQSSTASSETAPLKTDFIPATRVMWTAGSPDNTAKLMKPFCGQVAVKEPEICTFHKGDAIVLDFGRELHGGLRITTAIRDSKATPHLRIRFGESVSEAMSDVATSTATNEHSLRDFECALPWLGSFETGNTGFRFVRIDILDDGGSPLPIVAIEAKSILRDIPYLGSFRCSDERLNNIWNTAAYTVHLNMQDYVWDGIKRDRLVWIGDMHPEVMTINTVFGSQDVVRRSLDFTRDGTGPDQWMNGICSYSMWWCIIQRDLYLYTGNLSYLQEQHEYIAQLLRKLASCTDGARENFKEGRFIDWPTSGNLEARHQCLQAILSMTMKAGMDIADALKDKDLHADCEACAKALSDYVPSAPSTKQAAAFMTLAGILPPSAGAEAVAAGGAEGFATFTGYYMLEALAADGRYDEAMQIISDYWGGMLDLGATSFWEDLTYSDLAKAARIDEFVPDGSYDIHSDGGAYCYEGLRHSFCHGWASGPAPWLSRHILGVEPIEPGFKKVRIEPHLGHLDWAEGSFPTPKGIISISVQRLDNGKISTKIKLPRGVRQVQ